MFKNYLTVALRNLLRHKTYSAINILGLSVGMAFCILIYLFVSYEMSYDSFHADAESIYRIYSLQKLPSGEVMLSARSPIPLGETLKNDYPELDVVRVLPMQSRVGDVERSLPVNMLYADPGFLRMFTFPLVAGDAATALDDPKSAVISRKLAENYFGGDDPLGKSITINNEYELTVTGVLEKLPERSTIKFDLLLPLARLGQSNSGDGREWAWMMRMTYVKCTDGVTARQLEKELPYFREKHLPNDMKKMLDFRLQPLRSIHLEPKMVNEMVPAISPVYLYVLAVIAVSILLIACFNFMNLSTARYSERVKEIAVRKVLGANRFQLVRQFLGEAVLISLLAMLCSLALAELFLPVFNGLVGKNLVLDYRPGTMLFLAIPGFAMMVGVFAGSYPAFILSSFAPVQGLGRVSGNRGRSTVFRQSLVVLQFSVSIVLIISALLVAAQVRYMKDKDLGFDPFNLIVIKTPTKQAAFLNAVQSARSGAGIESVSQSKGIPGYNYDWNYGAVVPEGWDREKRMDFYWTSIDQRYLDTYRMNLVEGRNFSVEHGDQPGGLRILVNEAAVKKIGWESAVGRQLNSFQGNHTFTIIGVVEDLHFQTLHNEVGPVVLGFAGQNQNVITHTSVRVNPEYTGAALQMLKEKWAEVAPERPFEYFFLDEHLNKKYQAEDKAVKVIGIFSLLAILLACLGSFGLVALAATRRTKEIGIRKTLGASVMQIVALLCRESIILLGVAVLIAWPVAWYFMDRWLQDFAYRIELGPGLFVLGAVLALIITLLTVSFQAVKAATANPVEALRYE
jgi:putative ABC transport system permease protein